MTATGIAEERSAPEPSVAPPPGNPRFPLFDSLRGIAALSILVFHACSLAGAVNGTTKGDTIAVLARSIDLFFLISGFLLYRPFARAHARRKHEPETRLYARRRVLRIVPAYWVALTVLAIFPGIPGVFTDDWWRYYFFLQGYSGAPGGLQVAWSLTVEVAFYAMLPLWSWGISKLAARRFGLGWLGTEMTGLGFLVVLGSTVQILQSRQDISLLVATSILGQITWLALGMMLAVLSVAAVEWGEPAWIRRLSSHTGLCWLVAGAAYIALIVLLHVPGGTVGSVAALSERVSYQEAFASILLTAIMILLIALPAVFGDERAGIPRKILRTRALAWVGVVSYSVYLWHLPIAEFFALPDHNGVTRVGLNLVATTPLPKSVTLVGLTMALTLAIAALSYRFVELPFLKRKEVRRKPRSAAERPADAERPAPDHAEAPGDAHVIGGDVE